MLASWQNLVACHNIKFINGIFNFFLMKIDPEIVFNCNIYNFNIGLFSII